MKNGFTITELMVVISIVAILAAAVFVSYPSNAQQFALMRSAHKLAQDVRRAGEMAMSAKEFQGSIPRGGYGIHLKLSWENYYKLYADENGNEKFDEADAEIETVYLEKGVYIKNISPSSLSVNFKPPGPTINIKTEAGDSSSNATITLSLKSDPSKIKIIKINAAGLAGVE